MTTDFFEEFHERGEEIYRLQNINSELVTALEALIVAENIGHRLGIKDARLQAFAALKKAKED